MGKDMQDMDLDDGMQSKKYCIRGMHVAIIVGAVVVVGVSVGLGVGLTRPDPCKSNNGDVTTTTTTRTTTVLSPATTPVPPEHEVCPKRDDSNGDWKEFRLPTYINPVHYNVELHPVMEQDTYNGTVSIWLRLSKTSKHLWLHLRETKIIGQLTLTRGSQQIPIQQCFQYIPNEYLVLEAQQVLDPNSPTDENDTYCLTLQFAGRLDGSLVGFYRTTYQENGVTKSIAAADHEPTDARKSFPCFDEPNKKATYTISIIHREEYDAISNMPVQESVALGNGWKRTLFEKSVPMSTYLVCFAVHQFKYVERLSKRGVPLRIYVQPLQNATAEYAANTTKIVFDFFEEYFNMPYSLPKLDQIAIPDFGTGAMENWGLITYRETNLLYDPNESATVNKQRVAAVIAHELVHQWFGNIVTMDWWDDLWLNEGFASFFEYSGVDAAEPLWNMLDQILIDDLLPVMRDDALLSSHPIIVTVSTPAEITSVFDAISYNKGASILRMLEDWISPENFKKGCQDYLKDYVFKNAKTDDFWNSLAKASGKPVKEVMDTWTRQMGYPVLNVESLNTVKQTRFLLDPNANALEPPSEFNYMWNIPVTFYATNNSVDYNLLYNKSIPAGLSLTPFNDATDGFLKINTRHLGFFRVNYELSTWNQLSALLEANHETFTDADRAGLIDDAFALARAEKLDYNISLDITKYLEKETNYLTWTRAISSLAYLSDMLEDDNTIYPKFQEYLRKQVKPITQKHGWEDTGSDIDKLLRASVLALSCKMGDPDALNEASRLFRDWIGGKSIPVNLRQLVYRYGMQQSGNQESWNYMFQQYLTTSLAQEKEKLLQGLASANNIELIDRYNINDRNLGRIVTRISGTFNTATQLWQMENFFEKYPNAGAGEIPRKQALETVRNNIEWVAANKEGIKSWLNSL
ncbi:hypothetical protein XENTR_v10000861 [Xenopus tropicalis]|uniref:Aminopeptidase n=1 Tax=Xenopus tropicalis TaxID=8364 RepID=A0A803K1B2_XENTR|nr:hypothetical protein XENTR_v10000861 [Xenopus tropicalis]